MTKRTSYSKEFKVEAVRLLGETGTGENGTDLLFDPYAKK